MYNPGTHGQSCTDGSRSKGGIFFCCRKCPQGPLCKTLPCMNKAGPTDQDRTVKIISAIVDALAEVGPVRVSYRRMRLGFLPLQSKSAESRRRQLRGRRDPSCGAPPSLASAARRASQSRRRASKSRRRAFLARRRCTPSIFGPGRPRRTAPRTAPPSPWGSKSTRAHDRREGRGAEEGHGLIQIPVARKPSPLVCSSRSSTSYLLGYSSPSTSEPGRTSCLHLGFSYQISYPVTPGRWKHSLVVPDLSRTQRHSGEVPVLSTPTARLSPRACGSCSPHFKTMKCIWRV
jgi:hypothetical protein